MKSAEYLERGDGRPRQFGRDVGCNDREPEDLDVQFFAGVAHGFQIQPAVAPKPEFELSPCHELLQSVVVPIKLTANRAANEIRSVGIKSFLHEQIDVDPDRPIPS